MFVRLSVSVACRVVVRAAAAVGLAGGMVAAARASEPQLHLIWMGGNDCPPCVRWRKEELPKLQEAADFQGVRFSYVSKLIGSPVPPRLFLPSEVEVYKDQLDEASNRRTGSPQAALVVNGKVYDYFVGTRTAEQILDMVRAVREGLPYPFPRCLKVAPRGRGCEVPG